MTEEDFQLEPDDREPNEDLKQKAALRREQRKSDYLAVMSTPEGVRVLRDILRFAHIYQTSYRMDAGYMAFKEGERNVGLMLISQMGEASPELSAEILGTLKEQNE